MNTSVDGKRTHIVSPEVADAINIIKLMEMGHYRVALATLNLGHPSYISSDVIGEC